MTQFQLSVIPNSNQNLNSPLHNNIYENNTFSQQGVCSFKKYILVKVIRKDLQKLFLVEFLPAGFPIIADKGSRGMATRDVILILKIFFLEVSNVVILS